MFKKELILKKTHDYSATKQPKLAVVFIHGIASNSSSFINAIKYLEGTTSLKDIRFIAFDLLGSGKSRSDDKLNYDYKNQLTALHNSIKKLNIDTPLVLAGHSMGTLIATHYADTYKKSVKHLILISPPVYTEEDLVSPAFKESIEVFKNIVGAKNRKILAEKSFIESMDKIVLNKNNYKILANLKTRATLIYGEADQLIAKHNIPKVLKQNPKYLSAIKTIGRHGVSHDKYIKMVNVLEEILNA